MGIASNWSVIQPRHLLVTVEAPGYPRHPSSIEHDAVVKYIIMTKRKFHIQMDGIKI